MLKTLIMNLHQGNHFQPADPMPTVEYDDFFKNLDDTDDLEYHFTRLTGEELRFMNPDELARVMMLIPKEVFIMSFASGVFDETVCRNLDNELMKGTGE